MDFEFWWRLLTEPQINGEPSKSLSHEIIKKRKNVEALLCYSCAWPWVSYLFSSTNKEFIIVIQIGEDPSDIKDILRAKLTGQYDKEKLFL